MKLVVLLATYNSEKYLRIQIDSVLAQTFSDFDLYIRDDGSTDSTLSIIKEYLNMFPNIFLLDDIVNHRKSMGSFMWMLENVQSDYYMFCDHDDYWMSNKIELTMAEMIRTELENPLKPIIVHTDLKVVDKDLKEISSSFWKYSKINPLILRDFNYLAVRNSLTGCTMMINKEAKNVSFPVSDLALMHDSWVGLKVVASRGIISYVSIPTILYRQHGSNVLGAREVGTFSYIISKFSSFHKVVVYNLERLKMVQQVHSFSFPKYIFYKLFYVLKK